MNWDDLRIFLSVQRNESLTAAGKVLRLDPATIGRRIARLETELGSVLFIKSPQGYRPTAAGEKLITRAEAAEQAIAGAASDMGGEATDLSGTIRLGAPDGCATYLLPQVTQAIQEAHPNLSIQIVALPRVFNLSKREADLAIAVSRPRSGRLRVQKISDYTLCLAGSREYVARHGPFDDFEALKGHPVIGYIPDMIFDSELDYLAGFGLTQVDLASNLVSVQLGWLRAGSGLGVVHRFVLPDMPEIQPIFENSHSLKRSFWLIRHADDARIDRLNRFATALVDGLREELAKRDKT